MFDEYHKLIHEIRLHDRHYYVECRPRISDYEYDQLVKKLEQMEREHPEWVSPTSPSQRIGEALTTGFKQVKHEVPMLSLANTYSKEEIEDFVKRIHKLLGKTKVDFCAELKMDGVAVSVRYQKGVFVRAVTRGDGRAGDDITQNMKTVRALPLELELDDRLFPGSRSERGKAKSKHSLSQEKVYHRVEGTRGTKILPELLEVRGEVFMPLAVFQQLNAEKEAAGEEPWANPRNAAAGSLKLLDPKEVAERGLSAVFYGIAQDSSVAVSTQYKTHEFLADFGLPVFAKKHRSLCHSVDEIFDFAQEIEKQRHSLPFEIDGIVVKVDQLKYHEELGATGKSPRFAVAYKFAPERTLTRIREITVQVGRTGVLTPVAELEPVSLAGSTISRATLHNQEEVERKDIRIGDAVWIEKGGDVIPKVVEVEYSKRLKGSQPWKMPQKCPSCHTPVVHIEGEVAVRCPNSASCPEQQWLRIAYFAGKEAMDIDHLGEKIVQQLVAKGLVRSPADIYSLTADDLAQLPNFKEKSINNLLESIDRSREITLTRFILALGIKYVGEGTAELLAAAAGDIDTLAQMPLAQLEEIAGVGEKIAQAVHDYFQDPAHLREINALFKRGVHIKEVPKKRSDHLFSGKTFVLTGTLQHYTRSQARELIQERGGHVSGSVSPRTDYVLYGEDPGSKLERAKKLNIVLLTEEEFRKKL